MKKPSSKKRPANWKGTGHLPATPLQIKTIHAYKRSMDMDDYAYQCIIARHGQGVMHSNELSREEASAVISELEHKSGKTPSKITYRFTRDTGKPSSKSKALSQDDAKLAIGKLLEKYGAKPVKAEPVITHDNIVALATPKQMALIGHLTLEINWYEHGSYEAWLLKNMGLEKVVTKEQARNVIEGLKGLKRNGHGND